MTGTTSTEALSVRVLGIIEAYRMGAALDVRDLYLRAASEPTQDAAVVPVEGYVEGGVYHFPDTARASRR